jgi:hypothetical protein
VLVSVQISFIFLPTFFVSALVIDLLVELEDFIDFDELVDLLVDFDELELPFPPLDQIRINNKNIIVNTEYITTALDHTNPAIDENIESATYYSYTLVKIN